MQKFYALFLVSILTISFSYSMDHPTDWRNLAKSEMRFEDSLSSSESEEVFYSEESDQETPEEKLNDDQILNKYGYSKQKLNTAFDSAPIEAKRILNMLQKPHLYTELYPMMLFWGPSGTGKSIFSHALAYKLGWNHHSIIGKDIREKGRGSTAANMMKILNDLVRKKVPTIINFEEINLWFENFSDANYDTQENSTDFWTFMDYIQRLRYLYVTGTLNRLNKLPKQFLSRARGNWVEFTKPLTHADTHKVFTDVCNKDNVQLDVACDTNFLNQFLQPLFNDGWVGRDFEHLVAIAVRLVRDSDDENPIAIIKQQHLQDALAYIHKFDGYTSYRQEEETKEQRQEKLQKKNIKLQKQGLALQKEGIEVQREGQLIQKSQFVRNHLIQRALQSNQVSINGSGQAGVNASAGLFGVGTSLGGSVGGNSGVALHNISWSDQAVRQHLSRDEELIIRQEQTYDTAVSVLKKLKEKLPTQTDTQAADTKKEIATLEQLIHDLQEQRKNWSADAVDTILAKIDRVTHDRDQGILGFIWHKITS